MAKKEDLQRQQEEAEETIAENPLTPARVKAAEQFLEKCAYTTTCILALAETLQLLDDDVGARMLRSFAEEFREHEASTL
jgi:ppGpp synthetase/RelA/SpoT-type nucleotidyltranferase